MSTRSASPWGLVLALAIVAFPTIYLWRVFFTPLTAEPLAVGAARMHLLVVTLGEWPDAESLPDVPSVESIVSRGVRVGPVFAGSDDPAASAATLWTGRFVPNHGVTGPDRKLAPGTWTLAAAARAAGLRTGAFLQASFVRSQGIDGFDEVVEDASLAPDELGSRAAAFFDASRDGNALVWLHLSGPGALGRDLEAALAPVLEALERSGERADTLTVLTALAGRDGAWMEGGARVPLLIELPTALNARRSSDAHLSHVDVTALLRRLARLGLPDGAVGQPRLQGREEALWNAVRGGQAFEWVWVEGAFGHVYRRQGLRVQTEAASTDELPVRRFQAVNGPQQLGKNAPDLPAAQQPAALEAYLEGRREVLSDAVGSLPADDA